MCGIYATPNQATNACLIWQDDYREQINTVKNFFELPQRKYNPFSDTYNLEWRDYPNLTHIVNLGYRCSNCNLQAHI